MAKRQHSIPKHKTTVYSRIFLIALCISITGPFSINVGAVQGEPVSVDVLYASLQQTIRKLDSCHIVAANLVEYSPSTDETSTANATFSDIWLSGDYLQLRTRQFDGKHKPWWENPGFEFLPAPLDRNTLDSVPGLKACLKPDGDFRWAESRLTDSRTATVNPFPSLYSRSGSTRTTNLMNLPLIELHREWGAALKGAWFSVNLVSQIPIEFWKVVGTDRINSTNCTVVEVAFGPPYPTPLNRYKDPLLFTPVWKVWFSSSPDDGYLPLKVESRVRYGFRGREFTNERPSPLVPSTSVYEVSEFQKFEDGLWYPRQGKEERFTVDPNDKVEFDPDGIVDQFLKTGRFIDNERYVISVRRQWRVLKLEQIEPTEDLWFDPPLGSCVHDVDTEARFIEGASPDESARILGTGTSNEVRPSDLSMKTSSWRWLFIVANIAVVAVLVLRLYGKRRHVGRGRA